VQVTLYLEELDQVIVVAATNRPDLIDPGLLRPERIDIKISIGLPSREERLEIFRVHTKGMPMGLSEKELGGYAGKSEGLSGADIAAICREAAMNALRRSKQNKKEELLVRKRDFDTAFDEVCKSLKMPDKDNKPSYVS